MKKLIFFFLLLLAKAAVAQIDLVTFKQEKVLFWKDTVTAEMADLIGDSKDINKAWKSFTKDQFEKKANEMSDYLVLDISKLSFLYDTSATLVFSQHSHDSVIHVYAACKLKNGAYLSETYETTRYQAFQNKFKLFIYTYYEDFLPKYIKDKNKSLKNLTKEKEKAVKANDASAKLISKNDKKIKSNLSKIKKVERKIAKLKKDDVKKNEYDNELQKIKNENAELQREIDYNNGSLKINNDIIDNLNPQIDSLAKEINHLKLMLMEVEAKIKEFK